MKIMATATGLYHVTKVKNYTGNKPYRYAYQMRNEICAVDIRSVDILTLKKRVIEAGFIWAITDKDLAIITANEEHINPMDLNSNIDPKYFKDKMFQDFTLVELGNCTGCGLCFDSGRDECVYKLVSLED